jgi:DNA (cytosine-5)-methyltransferase 1
MLKAFDMFSGYGGFAIAGERNGIETVGFSEIDKYASMVLKYRFPGVNNYGDCTKIDYERVPDFDLLTFGFPCQSYSIAGKRGGLEDHRGKLIYHVFRALKAKQPKYFIGENVAGLLSMDKGKTLEHILECLCECGYAIDFDLLNAKNFGVPQNRVRVFIIGKRLDICQSII